MSSEVARSTVDSRRSPKIGELTATGVHPRQFTWAPHHDPGFAVGDELVVADFAWFSDNAGDVWLNVARPSVDSSSAPRSTCTPDSFGDDPTGHQWCCKPHEASEAEWSDVLAGRRARGELNPQAWPPVIDSDAFDVSAAVETLPDPADRPVKLSAATDEGRRIAKGLRESLRFAREPLAGLAEEERLALRGLLRRMLAAETNGV